MADIRSLEHPTLKVPYELLNKRFRTAQKTIDREVSHVLSAVGEVEKALKSSDVDAASLAQLLEILQERLEQFKARSSETVQDELSAAECCKRRIDHLKTGCNPSTSVSESQWRKTRVDRMLVEHFLRAGYYESAMRLAKQAGIDDLTNINLFLVAKEVEEALNQKDVSKCLAWCHDNKSKLRKMKSTLEYNVRLQEYIELIKRDQRLEAVKHARKYLASDDPDVLPTFQKAMALLAFSKDTPILPYRELHHEDRWQLLIKQFRDENFRLYALSSQSVFSVALQAGLSALKTPQCYRPIGDRNTECPVCQPPLNDLAATLPFAHCSQSRLFCFISGNPLNENNPPMMLPNGFVYGETALIKMATENEGQIVCPRTKEIFPFNEAEKVYVM